MKVNFMRFIDHRIGAPVCFVLSCVHGLRKIASKPKLIKNPSRILFIELVEMGSIVLAYSLFKKTKELFPDAELFFLTFKENRAAADILDVFPNKNVMTISSSNFPRFLFSSLCALWKLRRKKISVSIDMGLFARSTSILSYLSGAKNRVGFFRYHHEGSYRGSYQTHKVAYNPYIHMSYNLLNLIYAVTSLSEDVPLSKKQIEEKDVVLPELSLSKNAKEDILAKLKQENDGIAHAKKIILLNPNASDIIPVRRWPEDNYVELAQLLLKHEGVYIVFTGVRSERKMADIICNKIGSKRCINFAGKTTFTELLALYNISDVLVTNDSGPVHFSTLTDIKTFAFFGPETPRLYGPLGDNCFVFYSNYACSPCISAFNHRKSACNDNKCLKVISVQEVYKKVQKEILL